MRLLLLLVLLSIALPTSAQRLLLKDATVLDPETETAAVQSLVLEDGRVAAVLDTAPATFDGDVLDLEGAYLLPGLVDMHTHSFGNALPTGGRALGTPIVARHYLYAGVTGFLDLFSMEDFILNVLRTQAKTWTGADLYAAGPILTAPGGHGTEYGAPTRTMATPDEARTHVRELAAKRPDVVKLVYHPLDTLYTQYPSMDEPTMVAIVDEAHAHGLKVIAHINAWADVPALAAAGADAITHTGYGPIPDDVVEAMATSGMAFIPTLAVQVGLHDFATNPAAFDGPLARAMVPNAFATAYRDTSAYPERMHRWMAVQVAQRAHYLASVKRLADAGVPVFTGTDGGNPGVVQGYSVHHELALFEEAGLEPWTALAAATTGPSAFLGLGYGVTPGSTASFLILDADPRVSVANTQFVRAVVHRGVVVERDALLGQ